MSSTTLLNRDPTTPLCGSFAPPSRLHRIYQALVNSDWHTHTDHLELIGRLGGGTEGTVLLARRLGSDAFSLPLAVKAFAPACYESDGAYAEAMARLAAVAARVAALQHEHIVGLQDFTSHHGVRLLTMEWIDGYDLRSLLRPEMLGFLEHRLSVRRWRYVNEAVATAGPRQPRLLPGSAAALARDCLAALTSLHLDGIVHGDLKPSNVMLKRNGSAKLIDLSCAFALNDPPPRRGYTARYAAPEVLEGGTQTPASDLCSLGYLIYECLAGRTPFEGLDAAQDLLAAKRRLAGCLADGLPDGVSDLEPLVELVRGLILPDPARRLSAFQAVQLLRTVEDPLQRYPLPAGPAAALDNAIGIWLEEL